jgi:chromosome segregation ATPase
MSSLLQEVTVTGAHLRLRLEEYVIQVKAKNRVIKDIQRGNWEVLQKNARLETLIKELNDELMRTYRSRDFKANNLDDTLTRPQYAQEKLTTTQSYVHHLETELHERDEQIEVSQAQAADLQHEVEHLQELIPPEPEEPEEHPKDIKGMSGVDDDKVVHVMRLSRILWVPHSLRRSSILSS